MPTPDDSQDIIDAFTCGDCWALAYALADRYQGLTPHVLADDYGTWCHMLVQDARDGTYVDILGAQTFDDVQAAWECDPDWDRISRADTLSNTGPRSLERTFPEVTTDDGIAHLLANGWAPPPLRR